MIQFDQYFSDGLVQPPTRNLLFQGAPIFNDFQVPYVSFIREGIREEDVGGRVQIYPDVRIFFGP